MSVLLSVSRPTSVWYSDVKMNWHVSHTARCGSSDVRSILRAMTSGVVSTSTVPVADSAGVEDSAEAVSLAGALLVGVGVSVAMALSAAELSVALAVAAAVDSALSSSSPPQLAATKANATKPATQARPRKRRFP